MTMAQSNPKLSNSNDFLLRIVKIIIKISSDHVNICGYRFEVVVTLPIAQVPGTQNMLYSTWRQ